MVNKDTTKVSAVFRDENRHTCIRVAVLTKYTEFIPMQASEVSVHKLTHAEFSKTYDVMEDYPVKRAADLYMNTGTTKTVSPQAEKYLKAIVADPANAYDSAQFKTVVTKKEPDMATKTKAAPAAEAKTKGKAAAAPAKSGKPAAKGAAPAKTAAPTKTKAVVNDGKGREPKVPGTAKITLLVAENPKRGASAERFALYKKGMTVDDYIAAGGTRGDINWDIKAGFISAA